MKICPACKFSNTDNYPTCIWCNEPIYAVESTPAPDPEHPENILNARRDARREVFRRQEVFACTCYILAIPLFSLISQSIPHWWIFLLYMGTAAGVALWLVKKPGSMVLPPLIQAGSTTVILLSFGGVNPISFFMVGVHAFFPVMLSYWFQMIEDVNR